MKLPELLCPAGDESALRAAVDCGADAVYLGYSRFGARVSATNFDDESLERAVRYAHLYRARVHVTVNTLVKQDELEGVREALRAIERAGADAVIVQDLGVTRLVCREFPALALHASTQMALRNASDARYAMRHGFARVVLARECTLEDIREVAQTGVETEVFAHGALCTAVSGRCLMSSMAGGRSGNRGRCAQPCRQLFSLDADGERSALLSLKDLCLIRDLPALCEAGVASLKLEGRLKSAEYVAVVATAYRRALDAYREGRFDPDNDESYQELLQIFNRGGFTRGHAMGAQDAALCATERVGHEGVRLGVVEDARNGFVAVRAERALNDGDSLRLCGRDDAELRYSGPEVAAGQAARIRLRPDMRAEAGDTVMRLADARQLERARMHAPKPIPVTMEATFRLGEPMRLVMRDADDSVCGGAPVEVVAPGECVQAAISRESTVEDAAKQLGKLGGTAFALKDDGAQTSPRTPALTIHMDGGLFLPVSALNALRRTAVGLLTDARIAAFAQSGRRERIACDETPAGQAAVAPVTTDAASPVTADTLAVRYCDIAQSDALLAAGATMLLYEPLDLRADALKEALAQLPDGAWVQLPQQPDEQTLETVTRAVCDCAGHLGGVALGSVGQLTLPWPHGLALLASEGIPVTNVEALNALADSPLVGFTLWPEWTRAEYEAMTPFRVPALLPVYGREPLMLLNHCPQRASRELTAGRAGCAECHGDMACGRESAALTDRMGYRFPLQRIVTARGCTLRVLGALPTLIDDNDARLRLGAGALLRLTDEAPQAQAALVRAYAAWMRGGASPKGLSDLPQTTLGHWRRGVE